MSEAESASRRVRRRQVHPKTLSALLLTSEAPLPQVRAFQDGTDPQSSTTTSMRTEVDTRQALKHRPIISSPLSQVSHASSGEGSSKVRRTRTKAMADPLPEGVTLQDFLEKGPKILFMLLSNADARAFYYAVPEKERVRVYPANYLQSIVKWSYSVSEFTLINPYVNIVVRRRGEEGVVPEPFEASEATQPQQGWAGLLNSDRSARLEPSFGPEFWIHLLDMPKSPV